MSLLESVIKDAVSSKLFRSGANLLQWMILLDRSVAKQDQIASGVDFVHLLRSSTYIDCCFSRGKPRNFVLVKVYKS